MTSRSRGKFQADRCRSAATWVDAITRNILPMCAPVDVSGWTPCRALSVDRTTIAVCCLANMMGTDIVMDRSLPEVARDRHGLIRLSVFRVLPGRKYQAELDACPRSQSCGRRSRGKPVECTSTVRCTGALARGKQQRGGRTRPRRALTTRRYGTSSVAALDSGLPLPQRTQSATAAEAPPARGL
jgi:hypothetical protein